MNEVKVTDKMNTAINAVKECSFEIHSGGYP